MLRPRCLSSWSLQPNVKCFTASHSSIYRHVVRQLHQNVNNHNELIQSLYLDTVPPSPHQILAAQRFFETHLPSRSWTATEWRKQPYSDQSHLTPEVVFLGRSNSGKSSLLNAITNDSQLCRVGPTPGKTTTIHAWCLSPADPTTKGAKRGYGGDVEPKLTVLDMPGYGHGSRTDWGKDIMKYLTSRRQLRRAFVLVNPAHGLKKGDLQMLDLLRAHGISHQFIACKCDHEAIKNLPEVLQKLQHEIGAQASSNSTTPLLLTVNDLLAVGALGDGKANQRTKPNAMKGLGDVRWAILRAAGLDGYAMSLAGGNNLASTLPSLMQSGVRQSIPLVEPKPQLDTPDQHQRPSQASSSFYSSTRAASELQSPPISQSLPSPKAEPALVMQASQSIGIGMDALISMTSPPPSTRDNKSTTPTGHQSYRSRRRSVRR